MEKSRAEKLKMFYLFFLFPLVKSDISGYITVLKRNEANKEMLL